MHCVEFVFFQHGQEQQGKKFFFAKSKILTRFKQSLKRSLHNCVNELEQVISPLSRPAMIHICPSANNALLRHETTHSYVTKNHIFTSRNSKMRSESGKSFSRKNELAVSWTSRPTICEVAPETDPVCFKICPSQKSTSDPRLSATSKSQGGSLVTSWTST